MFAAHPSTAKREARPSGHRSQVTGRAMTVVVAISRIVWTLVDIVRQRL
jgi:hypothetical protein